MSTRSFNALIIPARAVAVLFALAIGVLYVVRAQREADAFGARGAVSSAPTTSAAVEVVPLERAPAAGSGRTPDATLGGLPPGTVSAEETRAHPASPTFDPTYQLPEGFDGYMPSSKVRVQNSLLLPPLQPAPPSLPYLHSSKSIRLDGEVIAPAWMPQEQP
ncbi:MAG: hypothetical protein IPJ77_13095 [Planctomycetes bacterium]|nr:hypothetical protein [Planctomycetota bacterium]